MKKTIIAKHHYNEYQRAYATELKDVYKTYSHSKELAFNYCERLMKNLNGYGLKILSANCFTFTVAFLFENENGQTCIAYITKDYDRYYPL